MGKQQQENAKTFTSNIKLRSSYLKKTNQTKPNRPTQTNKEKKPEEKTGKQP